MPNRPEKPLPLSDFFPLANDLERGRGLSTITGSCLFVDSGDGPLRRCVCDDDLDTGLEEEKRPAKPEPPLFFLALERPLVGRDPKD